MLRRAFQENRGVQNRWAPLFKACKSGNIIAVKCLLENHVNPNATNQRGQTALHLICSSKSETTLQIIQLLLKHNADIEAVDEEGRTPLFEACFSGNIVAVECLLENHANPNASNQRGQTALHLICSSKSGTTLQIIQLLLKHNADIEALDEKRRTPLLEACLSENIVAVRCFLKNHANPNATDYFAFTVLHHICGSISKKAPQIIQLLLQHNADVNAVADMGVPPLAGACLFGNIAAVKYLLENHANPNVADCKGETPLHRIGYYSYRKTRQIIQLLLKHNADIEAVDENGWTPLIKACQFGSIAAVKCLLENHANLDVMDRYGQTALHLICSSKSETTLQIIQLLLEHNADINAVDGEGYTPLLAACFSGNIVAVKCLLENHANPNVTDRYGQTALHLICSSESESTFETIQLLLEYNADIEAVDENGWTPLFKACNSGNIGAVEGLLRYGANINILDKKNQSSLQCAVDKMLSTSSINSNIHTIIKMLVSQIIKLKTARLNVNAYAFVTMNGVKYSAIEGLKSNAVLDDTLDTLNIKCEEEIERMKIESIGIYNMFFYDLLTQHIHLLGILMENKKIQEILKSSIDDEKFPLYIGIIRFRLRDAQIRYRRFKLKKSAREYFSLNINQGLPHECIDKVLDYLTIVDLKTFIQTFEPPRGECVSVSSFLEILF